jgi:hypothetical protein
MSLRDRLLPPSPYSSGPKRRRTERGSSRSRQGVGSRSPWASDAEAVDVQLPGQVTARKRLVEATRIWEQRNPQGTAGWSRSLPQTAYALTLWPPPRRVGRAADMTGDVRTRQPKRLVSSPGLTTFDPTTDGDAETALAIASAAWLSDVAVPELAGVRLAPPILEWWSSGGRLVSRDILDFGLDWPLPSTDGI